MAFPCTVQLSIPWTVSIEKKKLVEYLHTFMDFNKVFDRAWHEELLCVMRKFNIGETFTFFTDRDPGILNQMF